MENFAYLTVICKKQTGKKPPTKHPNQNPKCFHFFPQGKKKSYWFHILKMGQLIMGMNQYKYMLTKSWTLLVVY